VQKVFFSAVCAALLVLSGCATLSESQCVASDWRTVGYSDGIKGTPASQLLKHQNACVKHGIVPDRDEYLAGWNEGIEQHCQPDNGFAVGQRGAAYNNVCPEHLQEAFYAAYQDGRQLYLAEAEINQLTRQVSQKEYRVKQLKKELASAESALVSDTTTSEERVALLGRTKDLAQEQGQLEAEIQDLKVEIGVKNERLNSLRNTLAYVAY